MDFDRTHSLASLGLGFGLGLAGFVMASAVACGSDDPDTDGTDGTAGTGDTGKCSLGAQDCFCTAGGCCDQSFVCDANECVPDPAGDGELQPTHT